MIDRMIDKKYVSYKYTFSHKGEKFSNFGYKILIQYI